MNKVVSILVNLCRIVLAFVFIFSGYVKAIDPLGTQYKIQDYLSAWGLEGLLPDFVTLILSIALSAFEFTIGIMLLFAIQRRTTSKVAWAFLCVMTLLTLWIWISNPVSDCGCFGDAIVLTNAQTFWKNVILLACCTIIMTWPLKMVRFISQTNQWIVTNYAVLFVLASSIYSLYYLPIFDFRPYHVGANIKKGMEIPEGAKQPQFDTTFIMEKDGVRKEFTLDNYPDSTWQFVDSKTMMVEEGYVPPIHDFNIELGGQEDITEQVLDNKGYTFLLVSPHLENADDSNFGKIDQIYEYAQEEGIPFYCLTASGEQAQRRWQDMTGAEYPFCLMDEITLKTIIRSNPGLVLLKDATVIRKWSHNDLPTMEEMEGRLSSLPIGQMPTDNVPTKLAAILMWFVFPLTLLTLADRAWAWSKWFRRRHSQKAIKDKNI
ncbi:MAG: DoxX family protein [Prevotella sp.]|nr:DoxX family protein [Prevotella sp.]